MKNLEIERKAINHVMKIYKNKNVTEAKRGSGYDLKIGNRIIDVKGTEKGENGKLQRIFLSGKKEPKIFRKYKNSNKYWIYRVINVGNSNKIKIIHRIPAKHIKLKSEPRYRITIKPEYRKKYI